MKFTDGQKVLLARTAGFFSLHFVFHHIRGGAALAFYALLAVLVIPPIAVSRDIHQPL